MATMNVYNLQRKKSNQNGQDERIELIGMFLTNEDWLCGLDKNQIKKIRSIIRNASDIFTKWDRQEQFDFDSGDWK